MSLRDTTRQPGAGWQAWVSQDGQGMSSDKCSENPVRDMLLGDFIFKRPVAWAKGMAMVPGRQRDGWIRGGRTDRECGSGLEVQDCESSALQGS